MATWGFSGVDIDWEYPAASDRSGRTEDYANYPTFLANLKTALDGYSYGLSITLPTSYWYLQHVVKLGLAFYSRSFTIASSDCDTPGCAYSSAGDEGVCSASAGIFLSSEIEQIMSDEDLTPVLYKDAAVKAITWDDNQWVSFDDQDTFKLKGDFAKSQCLGGVLVWSVDYDDSNNTLSRGLAAALGNEINADTSTGLALTRSETSTTITTSEGGRDAYCPFTNCGEMCPTGFTTIVRGEKKSQLMLDRSECWVLDLRRPCAVLLQPTYRLVNGAASITMVNARAAATAAKLKWEPIPPDESQAINRLAVPLQPRQSHIPSARGLRAAKAMTRAHQAIRILSGKKKYNYCCTDSVPDAFTNCAWAGFEVAFPNEKYCSNTCPSGTIRIAEQSDFGQSSNVANCNWGNEAYCCAGTLTTTTTSPRAPTYQDTTAKEFDAYLQKYLAAPICPGGFEAEYSASFSSDPLGWKRSISLEKRATDQGITLEVLMPILSSEAGFGSMNYTILRDILYPSAWTGDPEYATDSLLTDIPCNMAEAANGLENLQTYSLISCLSPDDDADSWDDIVSTKREISARRLDEIVST
ncbi:hypothetical protein SBOR_2399 [Sclerotinia borealis F-4128]|uniref:chitinase n=1 Tax=Sclerotinia borealis (strain F-4128) TaxID=1432307 RepID=W9CRT1_SCLBF|nr:hypothetical protein SBOR_2399 [Sclerotinia borealis F-4128]